MDSTKNNYSAAADAPVSQPPRPAPAAPPPSAPADDGIGGAFRRTAGWVAGMALVLAAGWGFIYLDWYTVKKFKLVEDPAESRTVILGVGAALSFVFFLLLEQNFWLSRLSGFKVHPGASTFWSAVYYWLFGLPGMFVRTHVGSPPASEKKAHPHPPGHAPREGIETLVFVVVLVFLLKQFVVEAFVIPTGSMAETLYGYQKMITCPECGHEFPLNSSWEVDPPAGQMKRPVEGFCCPNCRFKQAFGPDYPDSPPPSNASGDRVLVHKIMQHIDPPKPGDVVVFKYPAHPQRQFTAQNYIKRMWGVGGDTIAIWRGDLYVCKGLDYPAGDRDEDGEPLYPRPARPEDAWRGALDQPEPPLPDYRYPHAKVALAAFEESRKAGFPSGVVGGFELIRKPDDVALAMRRLVFDNDKQSPALASAGVPPRWKAETGDWSAEGQPSPKVFTHTGTSLGWVRYRHLPVEQWPVNGGKAGPVELRPVDNFLGYNAETSRSGGFKIDGAADSRFWVGDLMLECRAKLTDPDAKVTLELSKGRNRFQAEFAGGKVTLTRTGPGGAVLGSWPTKITRPTYYDLRFANVDCRLRVWVDGAPVPLGPEADYAPSVPAEFDAADTNKEGLTKANDIEAPASVGATGGVEVSRLKVWRDTYFINARYHHGSDVTGTVHTYYVQPGHYLCLGDNSAQSSDGRDWGTVPDRLMLGRAVFVFAPLLDPNYLAWPRLDRIGFIK